MISRPATTFDRPPGAVQALAALRGQVARARFCGTACIGPSSRMSRRVRHLRITCGPAAQLNFVPVAQPRSRRNGLRGRRTPR